MCHKGVGCIMQGCGRVGHLGVGWDGLCRGGWGGLFM